MLRNHTNAASACVPSRAVMFTGQDGARTGVTQTDGILKSGNANNFPWLQPDGIPTLGDWFRADGYETHYFSKFVKII
jgi:arylsulfatase A-like enzyme